MFRPSRALILRQLRVPAGLACAAALTALVCASPAVAEWPGLPKWSKFQFRSQSPDEAADDDENEPESESGTSLDTPLIGGYVSFGGLNLIPVQGVGLIVGLDKTGEDPAPSGFRTLLVEEMKTRGITKPEQILRNPDTALVLVRAYIPPIVRKGDTFDVEVVLPPGSAATSLAGGWLLEARLAEQANVGNGQTLEGHTLAVAAGPVLINATDAGAATNAAQLRRGRVLGGGASRVERDLSIFLRNEFRLGRNSVRVAEAIGKRFHGHDAHGLKVPMAKPKTDGKIELKVPDAYRENSPRYLQVIRNIPMRETEVGQRLRMQRLEQQLGVPETSELAALRLEAIGNPAASVLKRGLQHADIEVRFNSAMALTYLGDAEGLPALADAIREEPAFRVFACAAMASSTEAEASVQLRQLLSEESTETRYGAFRALTVLNGEDPAIAPDVMRGNYKLHVLNVGGAPLVHLTHHTKAEVVLFGAQQQLLLPCVLRAGRSVQVTAPSGSTMVTVSRYVAGSDEKKVVAPRLSEIIRACDELGATYPDIAALLVQADRQHNLPGAIAIDALPTAGRVYTPKSVADSGRGKGHKIGGEYSAPDLFLPPDPTNAAARDKALKDGSVRTASAGDEGSGIIQAGFDESDAEPDAESGAGMGPTKFVGDDEKWYDFRRIFNKKPSGPPDQWEPGKE